MTLGARAFDVLLTLVERAGQLVSKRQLLELVWPDLIVEENNLQVQISALRKILGAHAIVTIAGRGYRFTLGIERTVHAPQSPTHAPESNTEPSTPANNLLSGVGVTTASLNAAAGGYFSSIAVLPFVNLSRDEENEYFADGLTEELQNVLTKIKGVRVASRTSSFFFKGKDVDIPTVAQKLNVAIVLEGSVRKAGQRIRISVQLVHVTTDSQLWSQTYDRTLDDIFEVQDDIAHAVVKQLRTTLLGETADAKVDTKVMAQVAVAVKGRATNPEAHRLYLQARHFIDRTTREDTAKGIVYLKEALGLDPQFALGWAELGVAYAREADQGYVLVDQGYGRAGAAAARTLALEPNLAEGHALTGWLYMVYEWDWRRAEASYRRALELGPSNALILRRAGLLAETLGRLDEAIEFDRRAVEQDPLSAVAYNNLGMHLYATGRFAEAEAALRKALELTPQSVGTRANLSLNLLGQSRGEEALEEAMREPDDWPRLWALAIIHDARGHRAESDAALRKLITMDSAYQVAEVYASRGEANLAFEWLERAYIQRDPGLCGVKLSMSLRSLRVDPRWEEFLRKMRLVD